MAESISVPDEAREHSGLESVNYSDAFRTARTAPHDAAEWLRLAVSATPAPLLKVIRGAHQSLGLRLVTASDHPFGWTILRSDPDVAVLGAEGVLLTPRIVLLARPDELVCATFVRFHNVGGRIAWAATAHVHRLVTRLIVDRAAAAQTESQPV